MENLPATVITLAKPFKRGDTDIETVSLREPMGGDLRGVSLANLINMDIGAVGKVLSRVSNPMVDVATFENMTARDITNLSLGLVSFLVEMN